VVILEIMHQEIMMPLLLLDFVHKNTVTVIFLATSRANMSLIPLFLQTFQLYPNMSNYAVTV